MAGGFKKFGPTYNSTLYVRTGIEGSINGNYNVDVAAAQAANDGELAGLVASIGANGLKPASAGAKDSVGLFREDLGDMINASGKASFYFRGGEYHVAEARLGKTLVDPATGNANFAVGMQITSDANGRLVPLTDPTTEVAVGTVVHVGEYRMGNMYEWAGSAANGGLFLGFLLHM